MVAILAAAGAAVAKVGEVAAKAAAVTAEAAAKTSAVAAQIGGKAVVTAEQTATAAGKAAETVGKEAANTAQTLAPQAAQGGKTVALEQDMLDFKTGKILPDEVLANSALERAKPTWEEHLCNENRSGKPLYQLEAGRDTELLNGQLPEKSRLEIDNPVGKNHIQVETNGLGRNIDMKVDRLERIPSELRVRDESQQRLCRLIKEGKPCDDGGHLIACEFGGLKEQINLSPMNSYVNRHGEWRLMEKFVEKVLDAGKVVTDYRVKSFFSGDSLRPDKFTVSLKVDGIPRYFQIKNPITNPLMVA